MKIRVGELKSLIREMLIVQTMVGPSQISGNGVYAAQFIPMGKVISKWVSGFDRKFPIDYPSTLPKNARNIFEKFASCDGNSWFLSGDDGRYFNHSDIPNVCVVEHEGSPATWNKVAARDILPGEELTMNYVEIELI